MGRKTLGKGSLVLVLLIACAFLNAAWVPFNEGQTQRKTAINVISANETSVLLDVEIFGAEISEYNAASLTYTGKEIFSYLKIDEYAFTGEIGKPKMPMVTTVLDVPHQAQINFEVVSAEYKDIDLGTFGINNRIAPALASVPKLENSKADFVIDEKLYNTNSFYPNRIGDIGESGGLARGHRLATLRLYPVQYNPVSKQFRCYTKLQVRVTFVGGDILETQRVISQDYSTVWEDFMRAIVVNYPQYLRGVAPLPIYYDIFYNGQAVGFVNKLATWKKRQGYKVRKWNAAGWAAAAIEDTIEAQNPKATYLVIAGDPNSSTIALPAAQTGGSSGDQTDLYYAETNGSGFLPDMFNARLAVLDTIEGHTVVDKAIRFAHANFGSAGYAWLKKACLIAGYDASYQPVGIATNAYCRSLMLPYGYQVDTLVIASSEQEGRIVSQINAGRAWCVYTAHGSQTYWAISSSGDFTIPELSATTNLDMYTSAAGHCCLAGDYQYSSNCFGETWDRLSGKGGIGYYGSVPSTYWDEDDWLQRRYFDAIYTDSITGRLYERGRNTQWGLYWINDHTSSSMKQYYFEAYHVFNDPSLDFWTDTPHTLTVTHNPTVPPASGSFTVNVREASTPLQDALVCCWVRPQVPDMHVSGYTDASGNVTLSISPSNVGDTMYVTVTKHNFIPYEGYAMVTASSGPYVMTGRTILNEPSGNGQANPGETVSLGIYAKNVGTQLAQAVYGLMSEADPYITLVVDSAWYGNIAVGDSVISSPYYQLTIANNCPNNHGAGLDLYYYDVNDSIWLSHPSLTVYAPVLTYQSVSVVGGNGNGILDPGETANLVVTIKNDGGAIASSVTSTLMESSAYITIGDASGNFGTINVGATANNNADPYTVTASASTPTGTVVPFQVRVVSGVYIDTLDFTLVVGKKHYYLWNPDPTPTPGSNCHTILSSIGYSGDYGTSLAADLTLYQAVLVCVGIYSSNYTIAASSAEAAALVNYLQTQGGRMYLEGGDVWYYDPLYSGGYDFGSLFGISASSDGSSDLGPIQGQTGTFTVGMNFAYGGENNWIDHIDPTGTGFLIFYDTDNAYNCGVANAPSGYKTVGTSFELGLLTDGSGVSTRAALLDSIMRFFGATPLVGVADQEGLTGLVAEFGLRVYPSISKNVVRIAYGVGRNAKDVALHIYDASGRIVKSFTRLTLDALRSTQIIWDGTDDLQRPVPAGVYFVKLETETDNAVQKAVLLR